MGKRSAVRQRVPAIECGELEWLDESVRWFRVSASGRVVLINPQDPWLNVFPHLPRFGSHPMVEKRLWEIRRR